MLHNIVADNWAAVRDMLNHPDLTIVAIYAESDDSISVTYRESPAAEVCDPIDPDLFCATY